MPWMSETFTNRCMWPDHCYALALNCQLYANPLRCQHQFVRQIAQANPSESLGELAAKSSDKSNLESVFYKTEQELGDNSLSPMVVSHQTS